jgi:TolB-like protein/class 3 adenylate cyclase
MRSVSWGQTRQMSEERTQRRLATILVADVVGYSRLVEGDEMGTLTAIRQLRAEVIEPLLSSYHGRLVKLVGDGVIVEFGSVVDAVHCAVTLQERSAIAQANVPAERRIVFRIGVNLGDVVVEGEDVLGDAVNIAARLEQLCPPTGVLVSGTAYDHLQGKLDFPLDDAGVHRVKNIARPVRTYRVRMDRRKYPVRKPRRGRRLVLAVLPIGGLLLALIGGAGWWLQHASTQIWPVAPLTGPPSVAILPFTNLSGDAATGRLANGLTEDIITDLARYRDLVVIAQNSTAAYAGESVDVRQVGRDLNVRYALEGSVQHEGDAIRITAQLLDATTGAHLWADRWDRPAEDIFKVQTEISNEITSRLGSSKGAVPEAERTVGGRVLPQDLTAYELYLRGRESLQRYTKKDIKEAIDLFKQALERDPKLVRAWVELAAAYTSLEGAHHAAHGPLGLEAIEHAIALDPMDAEAHAKFGLILAGRGELRRGEEEFETALRLNPGSADIMTLYAGWSPTFDKAERGAEYADRVMRLNPNYPVWAGRNLRNAYFNVGRYEDALHIMEGQPIETIQTSIPSFAPQSMRRSIVPRKPRFGSPKLLNNSPASRFRAFSAHLDGARKNVSACSKPCDWRAFHSAQALRIWPVVRRL